MNKNLILVYICYCNGTVTKRNRAISPLISQLENLVYRLQTLDEKISNQMIITKILISVINTLLVDAWESIQLMKEQIIF